MKKNYVIQATISSYLKQCVALTVSDSPIGFIAYPEMADEFAQGLKDLEVFDVTRPPPELSEITNLVHRGALVSIEESLLDHLGPEEIIIKEDLSFDWGAMSEYIDMISEEG